MYVGKYTLDLPSHLSKRQFFFVCKSNFLQNLKWYVEKFKWSSNHLIYRLEPIKSRFSIHRVNIRKNVNVVLEAIPGVKKSEELKHTRVHQTIPRYHLL